MKLGILGKNIAHSLSPFLHNFWMQHHALRGTYELVDEDIEHIKPALEIHQGLNITSPYKEVIIPYMDTLTVLAQEIGAINTIYRLEGKLVGDNTDYFALKEMLINFPQATKAMVLGNGGAAKAAIVALKHLAIEAAVYSRQQAWENRHNHLADINVIINATPLGLSGHGSPLTALPTHQCLIIDMVYHPLETPLLKMAQASGHPIKDGLELLIRQGQHSFYRWWGMLPDYESARKFLTCK
ncbi:MAG: shikimate dehydrogenase [Candidatus Paracaedibacteraceae bacterium]|nr:shikimate dehydrogenase [Candidatus Paracaedibacteraceae bacterium]